MEAVELLHEQDSIGNNLERLLINFNKDSIQRKTEEYVSKRLEFAESYWCIIQGNHAKLAPLENELSDEPYFQNKYFEKLQTVYNTLKGLLLQQKNELNQQLKASKPSSSALGSEVTAPNPRENDDDGRMVSVTNQSTGSEDITKLICKQKALMRLTTHQLESIESKWEEQHPKSYYLLKIETLQKHRAELLENDQHIWELSSETKSLGYEANLFYTLELWAQDVIIQLRQHIDETQSSEIAPRGSVKLPKITVPTFDGDYLRWTQFHDLFLQLVHNQPITNIEKMFYLTTNLTGEAKALVQHLQASEENYQDAWNILNARYNNKRLLVTALLNKLLSQPTIHVESAQAIKNLHDTTNECLFGLKNLGLSIEAWDPLIVHLMIKKLDKNTHVMFEQSLENPRELSTMKQFLKFQSLEALGTKNANTSRNFEKPGQHKKTSLVAVPAKGSCVLCNRNHSLYNCNDFRSQTLQQRREVLKKHQLCFNCMKGGHFSSQCSGQTCRRCHEKHNTLVHLEDIERKSVDGNHPSKQLDSNKPSTSKTSPSFKDSTMASSSAKAITLAADTERPGNEHVLLSTVLVKLKSSKGIEAECRAVLDSGSQLNFITQQMARQLNLSETFDPLNIQGIGQAPQRTQNRVSFELISNTLNWSIQVQAHVLPQITTLQPSQPVDIKTWSIPDGIQLADPSFYRPGKIDLLLGAEHFFALLSSEQIQLGDGVPMLQNTKLGWIIGGKSIKPPSTCGICSEETRSLDEQVEKFWRQEDPDIVKPSFSTSELKCESHFAQNVKRDSTGRFIVKLPFSSDQTTLGESRHIALSRFHAVERKLMRNPELKSLYVEFMNEYLKLGHMEEVDLEKIEAPYYILPHHCVIKPESTTTKLRVVFDASMKTSSDVSLNEILYTGPTIQDELFSILLRFRLPKYAFTADIEKMYRQIKVDPGDRKYQLIFWRDEPSAELKCYQLSTVTYGLRTVPYLATKCLQRLAIQSDGERPLGAASLKRDFYVDDVITGSNYLPEAMEIQAQLIHILESGGFKLRKWCSNHPALLQNIPTEDRAPELEFSENEDCHVKTLGLRWLPRSDELSFKTQWKEKRPITKRRVLSDIAHLFDPLGLMAPIIVKAKIFLQELWAQHFDWDDELPEEYTTKWIAFLQNLSKLTSIKIQRHVSAGHIPQSMQLHTFSDASEQALGAAIYVRSMFPDGRIIVRLLCAKSKTAPKKNVTMPRLELCAAKLAAVLADRVKKDLAWKHSCFYWTDSQIVLAWLHAPSSSRYTFVANRIAAIQEVTTADQWFHVSSAHNPADLVSRGTTSERLKECALWWYGPLFLHGAERAWPQKPENLTTDLEERQPKTILASTTASSVLNSINHRNSFNHLQRTVAYMLRYIKNSRLKPSERERNHLNVNELNNALIVITREVQQEGFAEELAQLKKHGHVNANSNLLTLTPFLDRDGIIRVGGRLQESELAYDAQHPILLPYSHQITKLIITHIHNTNLHIGPQALLALTRQKYWPIKGKTITRSIVQNCVRCARFKPKLLKQLMGNLPPPRVQEAKVFYNTGIDFCGPFWIHFNARGKRPQKSYVAIFCCFATKAVHIEIVSDLSTDSFIAALKRFISRRGRCRNIYCDNATNFVGARNQLKEIEGIVYSKHAQEKIMHFFTNKHTDFHFIPPRSPHFGGLWEAAVKSAKTLFQKGVAVASLTYEQLQTVMAEIEAILNSRPLTPMSEDPNDLAALTPGHFLIGEPLTNMADPHAYSTKGSLSKNWKQVSELRSQFWQRWSREYLCELQQRFKWKQHCDNVKAGTMVIMKDDNLPPLKWNLGRIIKTIKGNDGLVRVADVQTRSGVLRRAIHTLAPLPVDSYSTDNSELLDSINTSSNLQDMEEVSNHDGGKRKSSHDKAPKRTRRITSPVSLLLLVGLILPAFAMNPVTITPFKTDPGLYFEGLGTTHLSPNDWSIVVYYEMDFYWKELINIKNGIQILSKICNSTRKSENCQPSITQFSITMSGLENSNELLTHDSELRLKRSPMDIVGNIAHSLFGVLDSSYAEKMSDIIGDLEKNQHHLQHLIENQTSIVDSTINLVQRSTEMMQQQLQGFEHYLNQTIFQLNEITKEAEEQRALGLFNSLSIRLTLAIANFQRIQSIILSTIIDTHHSRINPLLLTPRQLRQQLTLIKNSLPSTLCLPTGGSNLLELYNLMSIEVRVTKAQTIFRIKIPLLLNKKFNLFRIIRVPVFVNSSFLEIEPSSKFLLISLHHEDYYFLSEPELATCSHVRSSSYLCKQLHPLYRRGSSVGSCEVGFLTNSLWLPTCKIIEKHNTSRWIQLTSPNHWIYVARNETLIHVECGDFIAQHSLIRSGILNISGDCLIKDDSTTLLARSVYSSKTQTSYTPTKDLTNLGKPFKATEIKYKPQEIHQISHEIKDLQVQVNQLLATEASFPISHHDIHQFSIGYIGLLIGLILLIYLLWKRFATRRFNPPIPAPRHNSQPRVQFTVAPETERIVELNVQRGGGC